MNSYLHVEIDGTAQNCAHLITRLLDTYDDLLIDQQGFLLIPANQWQELSRTAAANDCVLQMKDRVGEAA